METQTELKNLELKVLKTKAKLRGLMAEVKRMTKVEPV